jgi:hypothetical protein
VSSVVLSAALGALNASRAALAWPSIHATLSGCKRTPRAMRASRASSDGLPERGPGKQPARDRRNPSIIAEIESYRLLTTSAGRTPRPAVR